MSSNESDKKQDKEKEKDGIQVTVTFPLAGAPFHGDYVEASTVGQVRRDAMEKFGVSEDSSSIYYLTHNGDRLGDDVALRQIHDHARGLMLRLAKELVQG
jgi:hypothetical protein